MEYWVKELEDVCLWDLRVKWPFIGSLCSNLLAPKLLPFSAAQSWEVRVDGFKSIRRKIHLEKVLDESELVNQFINQSMAPGLIDSMTSQLYLEFYLKYQRNLIPTTFSVILF